MPKTAEREALSHVSEAGHSRTPVIFTRECGADLADAAAAKRSALELSTYENDEWKDISHRAVTALAAYCGVTTDYILGLTEIKNHPCAELHELRLDDKTMDLLKNWESNNRLLCEMIAHDGFQRLMMDIVV